MNHASKETMVAPVTQTKSNARSVGDVPAAGRFSTGLGFAANRSHALIDHLQRTAGNQSLQRALTSLLQSSTSNDGLRLPGQLSESFGSPLDTQLGDVRIHTDAQADDAAKSLDAAALTVGSRVFFRAGRFAPESSNGQRLLAHELTHIAQARRAGTIPMRTVSRESDPSEIHARQHSDLHAVGATVGVNDIPRPSALINRATETWYRGDAVGAIPPKPGAYEHDFGDGLYLIDREDVANEYATTRTSENARLYPKEPPTTPRVRSVTVERSSLGKVLDLTADNSWNEFVSRTHPGGQTTEQLIRRQNDAYPSFFKTYLQEKKIDLKNYDAVIGPEYVRGGKQICIRNATKIQEFQKLLKPIPLLPPTGGRGGGSSGSSGGGPSGKSGQTTPAAGKPSSPKTPPVTKPSTAGPAPTKAPAPVRPTAPAAGGVGTKGPTAAEPKPVRRPSIRRSPYGSAVGRVGLNLGISFGGGLLLGWMHDAMLKSAREMPSPKREVKEAGSFLRAVRDSNNFKTVDLISTTIYEYSRSGFGQERGDRLLEYMRAYAEIDTLPEVSARREGIVNLQRDTVASINELDTMLGNINDALKLEKQFSENIETADELHESVLYSSGFLITYFGMSVEEVSMILSNLKSYAASHRLTLEALKKLKVEIGEASASDVRLLRMLNAAWERGAMTEKGAVPATPAAPTNP